ncbi:PAS domain-containing sensor histidine kinase [Terriglobus aquaticus]|uniref:histidine kinase n=1 Tax=Terriglobus aquaticus TaxID=940139 RepID=A0ABW9KFE7_9BACT|nr:PAS domain-containing sensor histidine kinase [Terriglobus aquaticus]
MASMIRARNWSNSDLGPISTWDNSLLTTVNMILSIPTPVQVFWGEQMTTLYNDAFIPMLRGKHPSALGRSASEVWTEVWPDVGEQLESVFREGKSYSYNDLPLELLRDDGLQRGYFTFTYSPIRDGGGKVVGLLNLTQEVTETVHAREATRRSERRFRTLVDSASVGIAIGTISGELTYINPALQSMLQYTEQEVAAGLVRWDKLTPPRYAAADLQAVAQLQASGVAEPYEKAYFDRNGNPVPVLIGAFSLPPDSDLGGSGDIAVFAVDLRKQKRAEGMLLQSEKLAAVGKLASSISHEINNPLEAVTNLLYLVRLDESIPQQSRDYLETADRELARVSQVASQTLRFHRQSTRPTRVDPSSLVDEVLQLYNARFANSRVRIERQYQAGVSLTCYEGDIRQVLNNLIGNAIDAMRNSGGCLTVRTRRATDRASGRPGVRITVADTGSGMPRATLDHIFDAFYTTKGIHGTGLGLWISSRIVHKHRGFLNAYSSTTPEHHGTVFQLWLPEDLAPSAREAWHEEEVSTEPLNAAVRRITAPEVAEAAA